MRNHVAVLLLCLSVLFSDLCIGQQKNKPAHFTIQFDDIPDGDSLVLSVFTYNLIDMTGSSSVSRPFTFTAFKNKEGQFQLTTLPLQEPCYMSLSYGMEVSSSTGRSRLGLLNLYLIEPGDNVSMVIIKDSLYRKTINKSGVRLNNPYFNYIHKSGQYSIYFSGTGAAKYQCRYAADRFVSGRDHIPTIIDQDGNLFKDNYSNQFKYESIQILKKHQKRLNPLVYEIMFTDFSAKYDGDWYKAFAISWGEWKRGLGLADKNKNFLENTRKALFRRTADEVKVSQDAKRISAWYPYWIIKKEVAVAYINSPSVSARGDEVYHAIKRQYRGELRDKIVTTYLIEWSIFLKNAPAILDDALAIIFPGKYKDEVSILQNLQTKGKPAFNFSLPDATGKMVTLQDLSGKVVFIDFWYTACSNCVTYYKSVLSEVEDEYKNNPEIKFVTINIDIDKNRWLNSVSGGKYTSSHAINLNTDGAGSDHAVIRHYQVVGYPRPLLIDKQGKIFSASASDLRNKEKLKELIEQALK